MGLPAGCVFLGSADKAHTELKDAWETVRALASKLESPHADKVFVAKGYTKADLRHDLLAVIPKG